MAPAVQAGARRRPRHALTVCRAPNPARLSPRSKKTAKVAKAAATGAKKTKKKSRTETYS